MALVASPFPTRLSAHLPNIILCQSSPRPHHDSLNDWYEGPLSFSNLSLGIQVDRLTFPFAAIHFFDELLPLLATSPVIGAVPKVPFWPTGSGSFPARDSFIFWVHKPSPTFMMDLLMKVLTQPSRFPLSYPSELEPTCAIFDNPRTFYILLLAHTPPATRHPVSLHVCLI